MATILDIQRECWDNSLHCLGTSYIFSEKAKSAKTRIRLITVLGLVVPLCLGGVVATYGANSKVLFWALLIVGPISIFQLVFSGIALVYKWDDLLAYSLEAQTDNKLISEEYQELAKNPRTTDAEMQSGFSYIKIKDQSRQAQDNKITFSPKENRKGMRYGLWIMQKTCATCGIKPTSMTPTKCDTCGNF